MTAKTESSQQLQLQFLPKLPRYDGTSSVKRFLKTFEQRAKLEKWSEENQLIILKLQLTGDAESFLLSRGEVINEDEETFDTFKTALIDRYSVTQPTTKTIAEYYHIKQGQKTVNQFLAQLESFIADHPDMLEYQNKENELLSVGFMEGMSPRIKNHMVASEDVPFRQLVNRANQIERNNLTYSNVNTTQTLPAAQPPHKGTDHNKQNGNSQNNYYQNKFKQRESNNNNKFTQNYNGRSNQYNYPNNAAHQMRGNPNGYRFKGKCFYCGKIGHKQVECRTRLQGYARPRFNQY